MNVAFRHLWRLETSKPLELESQVCTSYLTGPRD